jgi:hypothetical protein
MGYAKLYSFQDSSIMEQDVVIRFIFLFMLGEADFNGVFDGSPESLARRANVPLEDMRRALDIFQSPDPKSKSKLEEGRRLIYQGANKWWLVNYVEYRTKEEDDRSYQKMQWRLRAARKAARDRGEELDEAAWYREDALRQGTSREFTGVHDYTDADTDTDTDSVGGVSLGNTTVDSNTSNTLPRRVHVAKNPPTVEEVHEQILSRGVKANAASWSLAEQIIDHNTASGWRRSGGEPIYIWKSHVNQWVAKRMGGGGEPGRLTPNVKKKFADERKAQDQEEKLRKEREEKIRARAKEVK